VKDELLKLVEQAEQHRKKMLKLAKKNIVEVPAETKKVFSDLCAELEQAAGIHKYFTELRTRLLKNLESNAPDLKMQGEILRVIKDEAQHRWSEPLKAKILGIGEITTTIELTGPGAPRRIKADKSLVTLAVKKAPSFPDHQAALSYQAICYEYEKFLTETLGIRTPYAEHQLMPGKEGRWLVYNLQERLPKESIACLIIQVADQDTIEKMFLRLLSENKKLFEWNRGHPEYLVGFDGQIPNWAFIRFSAEHPNIEPDEPLLYIDTTTPLIRRDGKEQLDTELFIKSIPMFLRPIVRATLLKGVLDRYYRPRDVMMDLIASFITHHRPDLVPRMIELTNQFIKTELVGSGIEPFAEKEISGYNNEDVLIWKFFRQMKRMDRFITEKIMGKKYEQRLPQGSPLGWENLVGAGGKGLTVPDSLKPMLERRKSE
jgi:hypothetical protein